MGAYRILVTGSRDWRDKEIVRHALFQAWKSAGKPEHTVVVTGGCPTGADAMAEVLAEGFGFAVEVHKADWATKHKAAGPIRNKEMVDLGADICLGFVQGTNSRGTEGCLKMASQAGIPIVAHRNL